ncbi:enoyl-CoA hydratase/isomerase family protein [Pleionea sp. CnH1-48]|uniref:enoyl-CoA hydratase/isomerase family protein n=1 Tax=Pleionea sp. CnH1-48 TaxID=2954494 RepID=UPI0020984F96|nr:enoyl-CoA hydratase/isomerase family protein [Pleionea sp. CnH1-48]MCO7226845.1 enoyl-CoA hydratase/isomerase family protein [Pleionea sp. CnH1-48]
MSNETKTPTNETQPAAEKPLLLEVTEAGAGIITLNRPEVHNAFDDNLISDLTDALKQVDEDPRVRLIVLRSNGKSFSAGADLNWMRRMADYSWDENYQDSLALATLMQSLHTSYKPTLGIVQGAAFGGGVGLVACCDMVIASEKALFSLSEVKLGLIPSVISPYVIEAIGKRQANRYFVTAERFDAQRAHQMGLVHEVVAADELENYANDFIKNILSNGPEAIKAAKLLIEVVTELGMGEELIRETAQRIADIRASAEGREGVTAFLEKRKPNWLK